MNLLIEIQDNKAAFFMELLKNFSFVKKAKPMTAEKALLIQEIKEAVEEVKLAKQGKIKLRNAEDFLNEL